jgi:hypothetical protein
MVANRRPTESPSEFNVSAILADIQALNALLGRYFTSILPTLTYRDLIGQCWYISSIHVSDSEFDFLLADDSGRKRRAPDREQVPYRSTPTEEVLTANLNRINICDGDDSGWTSVTPNVTIQVAGGYLLLVDEY